MPTRFRIALAAIAASLAFSASAEPNPRIAVDEVGPNLWIEYCVFDAGARLSVLARFSLPDGDVHWKSTVLDVPDAGVNVERTLSDVLITYPTLTDRAESVIFALLDLLVPRSHQ